MTDIRRADVTYPVRAFLDLLTAAISPRTRTWLQAVLEAEVQDLRLPGDPALTGAPTLHGYFVHVPSR